MLNTFFLYGIGAQKPFILYRLLSVASGFGALVIMIYLASRRGRFEAFSLLLLAGTSYPLILYFSEARGYAPAIFCALLAYMLLERNEHRLAPATLLLFWAVIIAGMLAHLTFVIIFMSLVSLSVVRCTEADLPYSHLVKRLCVTYGLPILFFVWFYLYFVREMDIGGGNNFQYFEVISHATSVLSGFPDGQYFQIASLVFYTATVAAGVIFFYRKQSAEWVFYLMALCVAPALLLITARSQVFFFRYLLVVFPFFYLLLAAMLGVLYRSGFVRYRCLALAIMLLMTVGQAVRVIPLLVYGRGSYTEALSYLDSHTSGNEIRIGSDHDFRNGTILEFYAGTRHLKKTLIYQEQALWKNEPPEWFIAHSQKVFFQASPTLYSKNDDVYRLVRQFNSTTDSGWNWYLYRLEKPL